jgi:hypothetical protein
MSAIIPGSRPKISRSELSARMNAEHPTWKDYPITIVGIRGYYQRTMGDPTKNDRGIYDDAIVLVTPQVFLACNGNTDPSKGRPGMATLQPGFYPVYRFDLHRGRVSTYEAICQRAGPVTLVRDGAPEVREVAWRSGINIHRGGFWTTGSEGCQTIPPDQWKAFYALAKDEALQAWGVNWRKSNVLYVLLEEKP